MQPTNKTKVITVINMKGGVGKTTLSVNTAYCLARFHGKKVLLVDIDPQFNATQYLLDQATILSHFKNKKTTYDILMPKKEAKIDLVNPVKKISKPQPLKLDDFIANVRAYRNGGQLDLIPSSIEFIKFGSENRAEKRLKNFINTHCKHFDIILIDCPPTLSLLTLSAYLASQYYLVPIKPDYLSSLGLPILENGLFTYEEDEGHTLELLGIVFTMVPPKNVSLPKTIMHDIQASGRPCFTNFSTQSIQVAKSVSMLDDFYNQGKYSRYSTEFKLITAELLNNL
jgi:chromosome partitioning protein